MMLPFTKKLRSSFFKNEIDVVFHLPENIEVVFWLPKKIMLSSSCLKMYQSQFRLGSAKINTPGNSSQLKAELGNIYCIMWGDQRVWSLFVMNIVWIIIKKTKTMHIICIYLVLKMLNWINILVFSYNKL